MKIERLMDPLLLRNVFSFCCQSWLMRPCLCGLYQSKGGQGGRRDENPQKKTRGCVKGIRIPFPISLPDSSLLMGRAGVGASS